MFALFLVTEEGQTHQSAPTNTNVYARDCTYVFALLKNFFISQKSKPI